MVEKKLFPKTAIINYCKLPDHIQGGMRRYIEEGCPTGRFLQMVIENNLVESFGRADEINRERMFDICDFIYNEAPLSCWGSLKKYQTWIKKGGLKGR